MKNERFARGFNKFTTITPCATCKHRDKKDTLKCKAFPLGIPQVILSGENQHRESFPGDHGIQYEEKTKLS